MGYGFIKFIKDNTIGIFNQNGKIIYSYTLTQTDMAAIKKYLDDSGYIKDIFGFYLHDFHVYNNTIFIARGLPDLNYYSYVPYYKFIVLDNSGKELIAFYGTTPETFSEYSLYDPNRIHGYFLFPENLNIKFNYLCIGMNRKDNVYLKSKYIIEDNGKNSLIRVKYPTQGTYGFISSNINLYAPFKGKYGFIDHNDNLIIPFIYDDCSNFYEGTAIVKTNNKFGFIDTTGKYIISPIYNFAFNFHNNRALVYTGKNHIPISFRMSGKNFALIDKNNNKLFTPDSIFFIDVNTYSSTNSGLYKNYYYYIDNKDIYLVNPNLIPEKSCTKEILKNAKNLLKKYQLLVFENSFGIYFYSPDDDPFAYRFGLLNSNFYPVTDCKFKAIECFGEYWDSMYSSQIGTLLYYEKQLPIWLNRGLLKVTDQNDQDYYIDFNGTEYIIR